MLENFQETSGYSYWLLMDEYASNKLSSMIDHLAHSLSSPAFIPHITLSSVPESAQTDWLVNVLDSFASGHHSINVYTNELVCGDPPFQRFYISLEKSEELLALSESMDTHLGDGYSRKENFHASLYYGFNSCSKIRTGFKKMESDIPKELHIQSIALADINGLPERWKIVCKRDLLK